jgi:predicted oxidoreductase (fatty acid repression mutant protein)
MSSSILELFSKRHSFYDINNTPPIDAEDIIRIITKCLELYPSPFNSQSSRLMVLFNSEHSRFWALVQQTLLATAPKDKEEAVIKRIQSFATSYGTILYFIDKSIITNQEQQMPLYAENFMNWASQSSAILQFMIWSALAEQNIGASLQHYNPLIDKMVTEEYQIPSKWELVAQMPFGGIKSIPKLHQFENIDDKIIIKAA